MTEKLLVKEMMFGTKEEFEYRQCGNCEALQIKSVPLNISDYYKNYYTQKKGYSKISNIKKTLWKMRSYLALTKLYSLIQLIRYNSILHWVHIAEIKKKSRILDVGCGNADVLFEFDKHGFINLCGIDPFLDNIKLPNINLEKTDLLSFKPISKYDFIMFNHSFEHLFDQHDTLKKAMEILNDNGTIMLRIPIINEAFRVYKENWVQIDAPRHFIIHSLKSIKLLCEKNGAEIYDYFFDSTAFQFLGSEQFKRGIPSYSLNSYKINIKESLFSVKDIEEYVKRASYFNQKGLGDQAAFFIRKKKNGN